MNMDLNKLRDEAFETAKAHGWHDEELPDETCLMLIITEVSEAVQADRAENYADRLSFDIQMSHGEDFKTTFDVNIKNSIEDELADVVIRCLDLAGLHDYDLSHAKAVSEHNLLTINDELPKFAYRMCQLLTDEKETVESRINYCIASVIAYCEQKDIDIEWYVTQKMEYNKLRPFRHGNKKY